ncbi:HYAL2 protein, partial [Atractosteus spatula]|nr:HYAL2 protein [Atractosteus spatula]
MCPSHSQRRWRRSVGGKGRRSQRDASAKPKPAAGMTDLEIRPQESERERGRSSPQLWPASDSPWQPRNSEQLVCTEKQSQSSSSEAQCISAHRSLQPPAQTPVSDRATVQQSPTPQACVSEAGGINALVTPGAVGSPSQRQHHRPSRDRPGGLRVETAGGHRSELPGRSQCGLSSPDFFLSRGRSRVTTPRPKPPPPLPVGRERSPWKQVTAPRQGAGLRQLRGYRPAPRGRVGAAPGAPGPTSPPSGRGPAPLSDRPPAPEERRGLAGFKVGLPSRQRRGEGDSGGAARAFVPGCRREPQPSGAPITDLRRKRYRLLLIKKNLWIREAARRRAVESPADLCWYTEQRPAVRAVNALLHCVVVGTCCPGELPPSVCVPSHGLASSSCSGPVDRLFSLHAPVERVQELGRRGRQRPPCVLQPQCKARGRGGIRGITGLFRAAHVMAVFSADPAYSHRLLCPHPQHPRHLRGEAALSPSSGPRPVLSSPVRSVSALHGLWARPPRHTAPTCDPPAPSGQWAGSREQGGRGGRPEWDSPSPVPPALALRIRDDIQRGIVDFETAAQALLLETLQEAHWLRPQALWGSSPSPACPGPGQHPANATGRCPAAEMALNDEAQWLWKKSSALYPSLQLDKPLGGSAGARLHSSSQLREALRVAALAGAAHDLPVFPLVRSVYAKTASFLSEADLVHTIGESAALGAAGAVVWEKFFSTKTQRGCWELADYVRGVLGPYVVNVTTAARLCGEGLCQGRGRCVRRDPEEPTYLHLPADGFQLTPDANGTADSVRARGQLPPGHLEAWRLGFQCQWYEPLEGTAADQEPTSAGGTRKAGETAVPAKTPALSRGAPCLQGSFSSLLLATLVVARACRSH